MILHTSNVGGWFFFFYIILLIEYAVCNVKYSAAADGVYSEERTPCACGLLLRVVCCCLMVVDGGDQMLTGIPNCISTWFS